MGASFRSDMDLILKKGTFTATNHAQKGGRRNSKKTQAERSGRKSGSDHLGGTSGQQHNLEPVEEFIDSSSCYVPEVGVGPLPQPPIAETIFSGRDQKAVSRSRKRNPIADEVRALSGRMQQLSVTVHTSIQPLLQEAGSTLRVLQGQTISMLDTIEHDLLSRAAGQGKQLIVMDQLLLDSFFESVTNLLSGEAFVEVPIAVKKSILRNFALCCDDKKALAAPFDPVRDYRGVPHLTDDNKDESFKSQVALINQGLTELKALVLQGGSAKKDVGWLRSFVQSAFVSSSTGTASAWMLGLEQVITSGGFLGFFTTTTTVLNPAALAVGSVVGLSVGAANMYLMRQGIPVPAFVRRYVTAKREEQGYVNPFATIRVGTPSFLGTGMSAGLSIRKPKNFETEAVWAWDGNVLSLADFGDDLIRAYCGVTNDVRSTEVRAREVQARAQTVIDHSQTNQTFSEGSLNYTESPLNHAEARETRLKGKAKATRYAKRGARVFNGWLYEGPSEGVEEMVQDPSVESKTFVQSRD
jgi:hypothetical protein